MNVEDIKTAIIQKYNNTYFQEVEGDVFFFYGKDKMSPFATIVTKDNDYDHISKLDRAADLFRLNIGVGKNTFRELFEGVPSKPGFGGYVDSGLDFTVLDQIMPHPMYGSMYWMCVLNPSAKTYESLQKYLDEAYDKAKKRILNKEEET